MVNDMDDLPRILLVDDEEHILATYKNCLAPNGCGIEDRQDLKDLHEAIFGESKKNASKAGYDLVFADQGTVAVREVLEANRASRPFSLVFLDMRMPPGQGGFETAKQIRMLDKRCNIVVVTAYSDVEVSDMAATILPSDKFFYLRKPFYPQEIQQFAAGLTAKWKAEILLEALLEERTTKLTETSIALNEEMDEKQGIQNELQEVSKKVQQKEMEVNGVTTAIERLFREKFNAQKEFENNMLFNVNSYIMPYLQDLKACDSEAKRQRYIQLIENNLQNLVSPFMYNMGLQHSKLTSLEMNVAMFITQGLRSEEIGELLGVNKRTVEYHRDKLREKLGMKQTKKNLREALLELTHKRID